MNQQEIGKKIEEKRKKKGLTQDGLAKIMGVSRTAVYKWEKGGCMPDIEKIPTLCEALEIPISLFLSTTPREVDFKKAQPQPTSTNKALSFVEPEGHKKAKLNTKNTKQESSLVYAPKAVRNFRNKREKTNLFDFPFIQGLRLAALLLLFMYVLAICASGELAALSVFPAIYFFFLAVFCLLLVSLIFEYQRKAKFENKNCL